MNTLNTKQLIARGGTADVFVWDDKTVLKRFHSYVSLEAVKEEAQWGRLIHEKTGLPVPEVGEIIQQDGWIGLLYERFDGPTMLESLIQKPWRVVSYAHLLASIQHKVHQVRGPAELPDQVAILSQRIKRETGIPELIKTSLLNRLQELPSQRRVCHGDLHPNNIIFRPEGEPAIIDWRDASTGHPHLDITRTIILLEGATVSNVTGNRFLNLFLRLFTRQYLRQALTLNKIQKHQIQDLRPIVAAARLSERVQAEKAWLLNTAMG